jgi:predicted PurR-regulated permease PerM
MTAERGPFRAEPGFVGKVLIVALAVALLAAVWTTALVFLLAFGGVVVAVALNSLAAPLAQWSRMPHHLALAIVVIGLFLVAAGFFILFGSQMYLQFSALIDQLPQAWQSAQTWLASWAGGRWLLEIIATAQPGASALVSALPVASGLFGFIANTALILVIGIYLAADSGTYFQGALRLFPPARRGPAQNIMLAAGRDLQKWLIAMTLDMVFLGAMTGVGLWLVGAPFPLALGILSGLSVFIPYIGPMMATIPGILLALSVSPPLALYAGLVYVVSQQIEGNVSLPLLQRWTVSIPPVVSLLALAGFGLLFGFWGVLLATPLAVVTLRVVRMAYVENVLEGAPG